LLLGARPRRARHAVRVDLREAIAVLVERVADSVRTSATTSGMLTVTSIIGRPPAPSPPRPARHRRRGHRRSIPSASSGTRTLGRATLAPERLEPTHRTAAEHAWRHVLAESPPGMDLTAAPVFHLTRHDVVHRVVVRPKASC